MDGLTSKAARGTKWSSLSSILVTAAQLGQMAVLARILSPAEFGIMGMALIWIGLGQMFGDLGMSAAVIHKQEQDPGLLSSLFWINVGVSLLMLVALLAAREPLVAFFSEPSLYEVLTFSSPLIVLMSFGAVQRSVLRMHLHFDRLALAEVGGAVSGALVAIIAAIRGHGVLSLVWGKLAAALVESAALLALTARIWFPSLTLRRAGLRAYVSFGSFQMGDRLLGYMSWNIDKILIGRLLGSETLGLYTVAWNLMLKPLSTVNKVLNRVAMPLFAKVQKDDPRVTRGYLKLIEYIALLNVPIYLGMAAVAAPLLRVYLGPEWSAAVPILQALSLLGILHAIGNPVGNLIIAKGRPDLGLYMNIIVFLVSSAAIYASSSRGIVAIPLALIAVEIVFFVPIEAMVRWKLVKMRPLAPFRTALPYLAMAGAMAILVVLVDTLILESQQYTIRLVALAAIGMITYASLCLRFRRPILVEAMNLILGRS